MLLFKAMEPQMKHASVKVVLLGETSVGKTCTAIRYVRDTFAERYDVTIGANFFAKEIQIGENIMNMQLWDTAGQEKYRSLTRMYYRDAKAALIFYDITDRRTFEGKIDEWISDVKSKAPEGVCLVVVGNKVDMEDKRQISTDEGRECAERLSVPFFEVSAKDGTGLNELFLKVAKLVEEKNPKLFEETENEQDMITLEDPSVKKKSGCC